MCLLFTKLKTTFEQMYIEEYVLYVVIYGK